MMIRYITAQYCMNHPASAMNIDHVRDYFNNLDRDIPWATQDYYDEYEVAYCYALMYPGTATPEIRMLAFLFMAHGSVLGIVDGLVRMGNVFEFLNESYDRDELKATLLLLDHDRKWCK